jgi:hypothetical protein
MQYEYEVTAKCPKKCGATRVQAFSWCCYDKMELRCPKCGASKEVSHKVGWKLVEQKDTTNGPALIGFIGRDQIFETPIVLGSPEHKKIKKEYDKKTSTK